MVSIGMSRRGSFGRRGDGSRRRFLASAQLSLLVAIALARLAPLPTKHVTAATVASGYHLRGRRLFQSRPRRGAAEPEPDLTEGIGEEIAQVEKHIAELEDEDGGDTNLFNMLESVEEDLTEMTDAASDPGTLEEGAIEEIVHVGEEIEELENQDGDGAEREKKVLASVEAELIQDALPPGCNLKCFFENNEYLADKIEHTEGGMVDIIQKRIERGAAKRWEHMCDCKGESAVIEEMIHVEEEIEELNDQNDEDAELEKEVLESVEEGFKKALAPGCDLDCFFNIYKKAGNLVDEHTEEALLDYFQKRNKQIPDNSCGCQEGVPVLGDSAPVSGAVEQAAIEEIVEVGEQIEELENQEGDGVEREKEVLASVEAELIRTALPPGCNLECFFENNQYLADKIKHTEGGMIDVIQKRIERGAAKMWEHMCDCEGESAVIEEMIHVKEEIEELNDQDGEDAELEKEVLESVEEGLIKKVLAPGCDVDCFFNKHTTLAKLLDEHTEEALLDYFQKKNKQVPDDSCGCREGLPVLGDSAPDSSAVEQGAIEEIIEVGEKIEELENQEGDGVERKKEVLASVEAELIRTALPPECNLECFFENNQYLADKIEHTEGGMVDVLQKRIERGAAKMWEHMCDCKGESAVIEEMVHVEEKIEELKDQDGDDAKLEKEVLESVEEGLIKNVLAPGCDVDCFFNIYKKAGKLVDEHTEEALLDYFQKRNKQVPDNSCGCRKKVPVLGDSAPDSGAVKQGAIEEIVQMQEEIEELKNKGGDSAKLEEKVLVSVEEELVKAALPPGCNLDCFFNNHKKLADQIEHTQEAVVQAFQMQKRTIGAHACDCQSDSPYWRPRVKADAVKKEQFGQGNV